MDKDFLLIKRMKQGDEKAIDAFIQKYYDDILKYCNYRCLDHEYAEDLAQETFIRFFTGLSDYRYIGKTKNYLYTVAGNLCKNFYKRHKEIPDEDVTSGETKEPAEYPMEAVEEKMDVGRVLEQLPFELYEIVMLYYFQELKLTEIASVLQIGLPLVKYRLRRAKRLLGELFEKEGFYGS